jgi:signal transduction histidine kinase
LTDSESKFLRRLKAAILLAGSPAIVGLALFFAYRSGWLERMIIYLRISLDNLVLIAGVFLSILALGFLGVVFLSRVGANHRIAEIHRQSREERRQFFRRLDHELKNPLTTLQVEIATLGREVQVGAAASPELAPSFQRLKEQVGRLNNLGMQLRKLAEMEVHPLEKEPVDLAGLLEELVAELNQASTSPRIKLNLPQVPWPLPLVEVDADLIYLAFHNLLGNAVKFTQPADSVQVRAFEDAQGVAVEIADNGPGIPEAELPHVWEELYRGQSAHGLPGSGLGLPLVRAIIERHGGQVSMRSRPNRGTIVSVRLPTRL